MSNKLRVLGTQIVQVYGADKLEEAVRNRPEGQSLITVRSSHLLIPDLYPVSVDLLCSKWRVKVIVLAFLVV